MSEPAESLWEFLKERKKYWLIPIIVVLGLFGTLLLFMQSSVVSPFVYKLF